MSGHSSRDSEPLSGPQACGCNVAFAAQIAYEGVSAAANVRGSKGLAANSIAHASTCLFDYENSGVPWVVRVRQHDCGRLRSQGILDVH